MSAHALVLALLGVGQAYITHAPARHRPVATYSLRTQMGRIECSLSNRADGPDSTGILSVGWTTVNRKVVTRPIILRRRWVFAPDRVRLEHVDSSSRHALILVTVIWSGASGRSFLTTAMHLDRRRGSSTLVGRYEGMELPGGYIVNRERGTILFWSTLWQPNEGESHVSPHRFRFGVVRYRGLSWRLVWTGSSRRKYPYYLDEEDRYIQDRAVDPLQEMGKVWPRRWTKGWRGLSGGTA